MTQKLYLLIGRVTLIIVIMISMTGCTQVAMKTKEITLGVAWPFDSDTSLFEEGIDMAVEEINKDGGIDGQKLILLKRDDASETAKGLTLAQNLSEDKKVMAVIGHKNSYVSVPASAIYEEAGLVMLSPASTAPELTKNNKGNIFRVIPSDVILAQNMAEHLKTLENKRIVIYYSNDAYGKGLADAIEDEFMKCGITVVDRFNYYSGVEELKRLHKRWNAFGFDGIFVAAAMAQGSQFINDARQAGINTLFIGGNALDSTKLAEQIGNMDTNIIIGSVFNPERSNLARTFTKTFTEKYNHDPDMYASLGYDAVHILAASIKSSKELNRESVAEELRNLGEWAGVCGVHEFSVNGDEVGDLIVIKKLRNGDFLPIEEQ